MNIFSSQKTKTLDKAAILFVHLYECLEINNGFYYTYFSC